jgi:hypothetical protein
LTEIFIIITFCKPLSDRKNKEGILGYFPVKLDTRTENNELKKDIPINNTFLFPSDNSEIKSIYQYRV